MTAAIPTEEQRAAQIDLLGPSQPRRIVVTGGAGFLGSHLCSHLLARGDEVICVDNLSTGRLDNLEEVLGHHSFRFIEADICQGIDMDDPVHAVAHLASPASPREYQRLALETLAVGSHGTEAALDLCERYGARLLLTSTSEVYGDPLVNPQSEDYWGNVNPVGPRSVYDEAKRFAEALVMAHRRVRGTNTGIVRIFNTYGPRLQPGDDRVVSSFVAQALAGEPLTVFGDGTQTRSFCFVNDLVRGLVLMLDSDEPGPINLGNPIELTIRQLADVVLHLTGSASEVVNDDLPVDDPACRCPDISRAQHLLGWTPVTSLEEGLRKTINWQRAVAMSGEP